MKKTENKLNKKNANNKKTSKHYVTLTTQFLTSAAINRSRTDDEIRVICPKQKMYAKNKTEYEVSLLYK